MTSEAQLAGLAATEMVERFRDRSLSPVEVHDAVQVVIAEREPELNAFWVHDATSSKAWARDSERRWAGGEPAGPLDGVPVTLKENIARAGVPMPSGTAAVEPVLPEHDAPITQRVQEAGAVVLGSTVMPDWGMLSSGVSSLHGVTRSGLDPRWTTGGSSSGAAAAATGGYGPLHVGTDIGGSLRLPASWGGLVTLKPSAGRVPLDAPYLGRCAGPLTRTAGDTALLMSVLSLPDPRDWTSLPPSSLAWDQLETDVSGLRIGLQIDAGCGGDVEPEVAASIRAAAALFEQAGAVVEPLEPFMTEHLLDDLDLFWRVRSWNDFRQLPSEQRAQVHPYIAEWCIKGAEVDGARVIECYQSIMRMQAVTVTATDRFDFVLSPVTPVPAFPAEQPMPYPDNGRGMQHIGFTAPYNMSGQPAASINAGFAADGRPVGVQVSGRRFDDLGVLRAVHWLERHRPSSAVPQWSDHHEPRRGR